MTRNPPSKAWENRITTIYAQPNTEQKPMSQPWLYWALLSAIFAALTAITAKIGVDKIDSNLATLLRTLVVGLFLVGLITVQGKWQDVTRLHRSTILALIASGLATGLSWVCYFYALKLGNASAVAPVDKLSIVLVAIFGAIILGENVSLLHWLGILLIAAGCIVVVVAQK